MKFKKSKKVFIHVDCDSFFASCEVLKNPKLKNSFVCVWQEIVVACTYNCKRLWVKTGMPVWQAKKILKNRWIFLKNDMWFYQKISNKLFEYLKEKTLWIEDFSIDEAFCEITGIPEYENISLEKYLKNMQSEILKRIWIPVSVWCSETRIKAKIYSKVNKPFGIFIWFDLEKEIRLFKKLPLRQIPFIWTQTGKKIESKVENIYDFIQLGFWELKKRIWKNATDLRLELVWVNAFIVKKSKQEKSISRSRSFNKNINNNPDFLYEQLISHFEKLFIELTSKNLATKKVSIFFRTKNFEVIHFDYNFWEYIFTRKKLFFIVKKLFEKNFSANFLYRSVGIIFSDLKKINPFQLNIFDDNLRSNQKNLELQKKLNIINQKYHKNIINFWCDNFSKTDDLKLFIRK